MLSVTASRPWWRDLSLSSITAGLVTVLVGFASSVVIVFQAAQALGADTAQIGSWMWALCLGIGVTGIAMSLYWRMPVVTAWSTPGAAMLVASTGSDVSLAEASGAFVVAAVLTAIVGFSGAFERALRRIPVSLAAGMLAGVLLRFGLDAFLALQQRPWMVLAMLATYLLGRRTFPRHAVLATLLVGIGVAALQGTMHWEQVQLRLARPDFVMPAFSWQALIGIALPLFMVTMASQNLPGVAVMRTSGYPAPVSPMLGWIGTANAVLAPFGAFAFNLAAITAAICMGREAAEDPARRYTAAVVAGVLYLLIGLFGATVAAVLLAFPKALVMAVAGIALFGTIGSSLTTAMREESEREPALIAFLVTASGLSLGGIGSAFWGLVAGALTLLVLGHRH